MKFAIPRIWPQPTDHSSNCYFCMVDPTKQTSHWQECPSNCLSRHSFFQYQTAPSCLFPLPQRGISHLQETAASQTARKIWRSRFRFHRCVEERRPYFPNQKDVNDLIRDLGLTKSNAKLLISRLKQWNLLDESVQVTDQRKCHETFSNFFSRQDELCFCNNVAGLFEAIGITCNPSEWRLFIDSSLRASKRSASQRKQLPVSPYGSLCASQRGLHQCEDVAECLEV